MQSNGLWPEPTLKTRVFEVKAKARGVPGQGQDFSWPRPEIFVLEVSSRLRTVLKDPLLVGTLCPSQDYCESAACLQLGITTDN